MSIKPNRATQETTNRMVDPLHGCLVDGDPERRYSERRIRRRALVISLLLQGAVLAGVVLVPLFMKPVHIALAGIYVPMPPYRPVGTAAERPARPSGPTRPNLDVHCVYCPPTYIPTNIVTEDGPHTSGAPSDAFPGTGEGCAGCIPIEGTETGPEPPGPPTIPEPTIVHRSHIDPAMLAHRVEPIYPSLGRQMHREGRVELRAIIATDGTIRSLQAVSGDPLFYESALEAVRQWRYNATILNGRAVEIDTYITVIYSLQR